MTDPFGQPGGGSLRAPRVQNFRYKIVDPETGKPRTLTRVTTFAKAISDMAGLRTWEKRLVVKGMGLRADLFALAMATPLEDKKTLEGIAYKAKEMAGGTEGANRGTAMHELTEIADRGGSIAHAAPTWIADVEAYQAALTAASLHVDRRYIERFVYIPEFELCGKLDRIYAQWGGEVGMLAQAHLIGDVKTAKNIEYGWGDIAIQLALYAAASHYWDEEQGDDGDWVEMPATVRKDVAVVAHIPIEKSQTDIYEVNIAAGLEAARLCKDVRAWRQRRDLAWPSTVPSPATVKAFAVMSGAGSYAQRLNAAKLPADLTQVWKDATAAGAWTDELEALGKKVLAGLTS